MKNYIKSVAFVFVLSMGLQSCSEYLDLVPDNIPSIDTVFETKTGALSFRRTLYSYLPNFQDFTTNHAQMSGDESWLADVAFDRFGIFPPQRIPRGLQSSGNTALDSWGNLYTGIRDCNVFLDNVDAVHDLTGVERDKWKAEAKFLKAYYHFFLMRQYGPIPIVRENIEVNAGSDIVQIPRNSVDDVAQYIVELIDEAMPNLPVFLLNPESDYGTITRPIAAAIKARTLITIASPLFNGNSDYIGFTDAQGNELISTVFNATKWDAAATACKEAIDLAETAGHRLFQFNEGIVMDDLSDETLLKMSIRGSFTAFSSNEVIWPATGRIVTNQTRSIARLNFPGSSIFTRNEAINSFHAPTLRVAETFYSNNGVPINEDINYDFNNRYTTTSVTGNQHTYYIKQNFETAKLNLNREPRFYASLGFDGNLWFGQGVTDDENSLIVEAKANESAGKNLEDRSNVRFSATGYFAKKLTHYRTSLGIAPDITLNTVDYAWPIIRLADLYLMYAEALNEMKASPDSEVYEYIDNVRTRAGLDGVINSWSMYSNNPSKPTTKEGMRSIIQQERMIELVFEGNRFWDLRRWKRASDFMNLPIRGWNVDGESTASYYNLQTLFQPTFTTKDYLWPISLSVILRNRELIQNPGW